MSRLLERMNALLIPLQEGKRDEYLARVLRPVFGYPLEWQREKAEKLMDRILSHPILSRRDWLDWLAKGMRIDLLHDYATVGASDEDDRRAVKREAEKLARKLGDRDPVRSPKDAFSSWNFLDLKEVLAALEHYLSLPVPAIRNHHPRNESPRTLLSIFRKQEEEWMEKTRDVLTPEMIDEQGAVEFLRCSDGTTWFHVEKESCPIEAHSMGHCGNEAHPLPGDTILSLRSPKGDAGHWRVNCTFILNDGILGEMKGRGNDKPKERYHDPIVELLRSGRIRAIAGGGFSPENNFRIDDLDPDRADELTRGNPGFGLFMDHYRAGPEHRPLLIERLNHYFCRCDSIDSLDSLSLPPKEAVNGSNDLVVLEGDHVLEDVINRFFLNRKSSDGLKHALRQYEEGFERYFDHYDPDSMDMSRVFEATLKDRPDLNLALQRQLREEFPEPWEAFWEDPDSDEPASPDDLFEFLEEHASGGEVWWRLKDACRIGMEDSLISGLGNELHSYFSETETEAGGCILLEDNYFNLRGRCWLAIPVESLCAMADRNATPSKLESEFFDAPFDRFEWSESGSDGTSDTAIDEFASGLSELLGVSNEVNR